MGCFKTADQDINVAAAGDNMYNRLCNALGAPHLIDKTEYKTFKSRAENKAQLNAEIEAILTTRPAADWIEILNQAGVPCGPVNTIDQVFSDPQVEHLGVVHHVDHAKLGKLAVVGQPVSLSLAPQPETFRHPTPEPGEHTDEILREVGFAEEEIARLRSANAI
jgi:crotonobetainyl-CoA:carnitine CoA-transferase CaiB-like acyl-CoA transferase